MNITKLIFFFEKNNESLKKMKKRVIAIPAIIIGFEIRKILIPEVLNAVISLFLAKSPIEKSVASNAATGNISEIQLGNE